MVRKKRDNDWIVDLLHEHLPRIEKDPKLRKKYPDLMRALHHARIFKHHIETSKQKPSKNEGKNVVSILTGALKPPKPRKK